MPDSKLLKHLHNKLPIHLTNKLLKQHINLICKMAFSVGPCRKITTFVILDLENKFENTPKYFAAITFSTTLVIQIVKNKIPVC